MKKRRIAILMHEDFKKVPDWYFINFLIECWRSEGHKVIFLFGTKQFVPADVLLVHVDLSVVPDSYLTFADRYPVVINGRVNDIRKSTFSEGLLHAGDPWEGQVIVKSDKNYAGAPESRHGKTGFVERAHNKLTRMFNSVDLEWIAPTLKRPCDYHVYDNLQEVPRLYFYNPELVIQKFIPEMDGDLYCVRFMFFFGDRMHCVRLKSKTPVVNTREIEFLEADVEPHPHMIALRDQFEFDYGKFDYVVIDGKAFLLDINKTIGAPHANNAISKTLAEGIADFSNGLYSFL